MTLSVTVLMLSNLALAYTSSSNISPRSSNV